MFHLIVSWMIIKNMIRSNSYLQEMALMKAIIIKNFLKEMNEKKKYNSSNP